MKQRIVVLGASGFIGRRIVRALAGTDQFVPVAVSRSATRVLRDSGTEAHDLDVSRPGAVAPLLAGASSVVNCIAGSADAILAGTQALLDAVDGLSPAPRIVHLSSLAAYGSTRGRIDESMPLRGDLDAYSAAKARTDESVMRRPSAVVLRPGIVFGPGSVWWSDRIARLLVAHRLGDLGPRGQGICNLVYVDDVAAAVVRAVAPDGAASGAFNLASPVAVTWNEYFERYARALKVMPLRSISSFRLATETRLLSPALKVAESLLRGPALVRWNPWPPLRPWLVEMCARDALMDVTRAELVLGMTWTPLDAALETTARWFREGGRTVW